MTGDVFQRPEGDDRILWHLELHDQQVRPVRVGDVLSIHHEGWFRIIGWTPLENGRVRYVVETCDNDTPLTLHARGHFTLATIPTSETRPPTPPPAGDRT